MRRRVQTLSCRAGVCYCESREEIQPWTYMFEEKTFDQEKLGYRFLCCTMLNQIGALYNQSVSSEVGVNTPRGGVHKTKVFLTELQSFTHTLSCLCMKGKKHSRLCCQYSFANPSGIDGWVGLGSQRGKLTFFYAIINIKWSFHELYFVFFFVF